LVNKSNELIKCKDNLSYNLENFKNKYNDLNEIYKTTLDNFNQKANNFHILEDSLKESNNEVNLYKETLISMQSEMTTLKTSLLSYITEINLLKDQMASQKVIEPVIEEEEEQFVMNMVQPIAPNVFNKKKGCMPSKRK
jgi:chromosome segregation ATPase